MSRQFADLLLRSFVTVNMILSQVIIVLYVRTVVWYLRTYAYVMNCQIRVRMRSERRPGCNTYTYLISVSNFTVNILAVCLLPTWTDDDGRSTSRQVQSSFPLPYAHDYYLRHSNRVDYPQRPRRTHYSHCYFYWHYDPSTATSTLRTLHGCSTTGGPQSDAVVRSSTCAKSAVLAHDPPRALVLFRSSSILLLVRP